MLASERTERLNNLGLLVYNQISEIMNKIILPIFCASLYLFSACEYLDYPSSPGPDYTRSAKQEINDQLDIFIESETNKDGDAHRQLFLSESSPINFVLKNYGNPFVFSLQRDSWIGFFLSWDYAYYPVYSEQSFFIEKGVAIEKNRFLGFKNEAEDIYGTDQFMFVKTSDDWKILDLSSVIINPDDTVDYQSLKLVNSSPDSIMHVFQTALKEGYQEDFLSSFISDSSPCVMINETFSGTFDNEAHTATAFYDTIDKEQFDFGAVEITIHDDLLAVAEQTYVVKLNGEIVDHGKILASLTGSPGQEWKISALVFTSYSN